MEHSRKNKLFLRGLIFASVLIGSIFVGTVAFGLAGPQGTNNPAGTGSGLLRTDSTGSKLGVGVSSDPTERLEVNGGVKIGTTNGVNAGTIRYNSSLPTPDFQGYSGGAWQSLSSIGSGWTDTGTSVTLITGTDNVGIGAAPTNKLTVAGALNITGTLSTAAGLTLSDEATYKKIQSNESEILSLNPTGNNVAIGKTTAAENLEVNGAIKIGTTAGANAGTIRYNATIPDFEGYSGGAWHSLSANGAGWQDNGTTVTLVTASDNVGVGGVPIAGSKLNVFGDIFVENGTGGYQSRIGVAANKNFQITGSAADGNDYFRIWATGTGDAGALEISTGDNGDEPIIFKQNNGGTQNERLRIDSIGRIGISKSVPTAILDVAGTIGVSTSSYTANTGYTLDVNGTVNATRVLNAVYAP